ncbi:histidine ammonia-lyase [Candidatus Chloroploca sp. Khr17]|uniref:histidine ammonia-lyase n=1 Tax=Candidatus Chloroploca sp. Khr17 TaxID=2496869 RepID=UPI00101DB68F|nr:histidine ammonia-lyase [Candidatus Chloroploca sp. Khr17]
MQINGEALTIAQVLNVAYGQPGAPLVALSPAATTKVARAAWAVEQLLERGEIAYGITTGFGAFKDRLIPPDQVVQLQHNIVMSHAVGVGPLLDLPTVRAMMLIRANTLARGHSGIRPATLELLLAMLNAGVHPLIPSKGSLGASGDLAPLAHMALPLIGLGEAEYRGERLPGAEALRRAGLAPCQLAAKEGLALTNGTTGMCALGALETHRAEVLSQTADIAGCLSLEALNGTVLAFDERIHALRPFPRQQECAAYLRALLAGSELTRGHDPRNVQDAYTLRCIPQVHGAVRDAIAYARWVFAIELNAVTDNPLIFLDDEDQTIAVLSGGNFHGEPLAIALDYLGLAVTELGNIAERRIMRLTDEASNTQTLPAFLTSEGGLNSGFMLVQYTAAALATENKILAHPASVDTIPSSANVEDHVSMGMTAGLKTRTILDNVAQILAIELLAAAQGLDFRRQIVGPQARLGRGTAAAYELIRQHVPFIERDTVMYPHIEAVRMLVADGSIVAAVTAAMEG